MFSKSRLLGLLTLLSVGAISSVQANNWELNEFNGNVFNGECVNFCEEPCVANRFYIGGFGGGLYSTSTHMYQMGTAFFTPPLAVYAHGDTGSTSSGFGGFQIGYEAALSAMRFGCSGWGVTPSVEIEGFWYKHNKSGHLFNNTLGRLEEHDFLVSFRMHAGVYLANLVLAVQNPWLGEKFTPYVGGGVGAARLSISNATSIQVSPAEAFNHFNSKQSDSSWAFAAQAKAGLRYNICDRFHIFGEYRYVFLDTTKYILGSTSYPIADHVPTTPWNVQIKNLHYNAFTVGLQYDL